MYVLVLIVVSLIMAWILQVAFKNIEVKEVAFKNIKVKGGYWNRFVGAIIGALLGDLILGNWGWMLGGYNVFAGIIGSFFIGWGYLSIFKQKSEVNKS